MNDPELKKLWQTTHETMAANFVINKKITEDITRVKVHTLLGSMKPLKIFTLLIGFLWVGIGAMALGAIYTYTFPEANKFFLYSATVQILLTAMALIIYIYQLTQIFRVALYDPILQTQQKLAQLKISTLWAVRIMALQLPVWTTFWWNETMLTDWNIWQWAITLSVTVSFTFLALWLFFNIKQENMHKKWFKRIFAGKEWTPLLKSVELLEELDEYKADTNVRT